MLKSIRIDGDQPGVSPYLVGDDRLELETQLETPSGNFARRRCSSEYLSQYDGRVKVFDAMPL